MKVEETLTTVQRSLWIVDNATVRPLSEVDENGKVLALEEDAAEPVAAVELLEKVIRPTNRGVQKVGLTVRVWLALLFVAAYRGRATVAEMHAIATGELPREVQWELGIVTCDCTTPTCDPQDAEHGRMLTAKQLYGVSEAINRFLDIDPNNDKLTDEDRAARMTVIEGLKDAFLLASQAVPSTTTAFAVDESGIWSWFKAPSKRNDLPEVDPTDEEANAQGEAQIWATRNGRRTGPTLKDRAAGKQTTDTLFDDEVFEPLLDEDFDDEPLGDQTDENKEAQSDNEDNDGGEEQDRAPRKKKLQDWFATWGVKTHKSGKSSAYYGYALHVLLRVPMLNAKRTCSGLDLPLLVEQFQITPASTDIVDVTLRMVKKVIARGGKVGDLIGDRHYSYKKFERWALVLWKMDVKPVLDLRKNDHGVMDYNGAQILAGWPHCGVPQHLLRIERPGRNATRQEWAEFYASIEERQRYAMIRHTPVQGDGKSRWICAAQAGLVGCPSLDGSIEAARRNGLPIITPPEGTLPWCTSKTAQIPVSPVMKYQQEEYWGTEHGWEPSWNRRTWVEGAFGNLKNHHTGNIHRGFTCFTGLPLVTLAYTAAVVAYNVREQESWFERASSAQPDNPLLTGYAVHPLHQRTPYQHGFTMLSQSQRVALDRECAQAA